MLLRIFIFIICVVIWVVIELICMGSFINYDKSLKWMRKSRQMNYPVGELHPLLNPAESCDYQHLWSREQSDDSNVSQAFNLIPDVEEEKCYPYYLRTGQIVCNAQLRTFEDIKTGRWYDYSEWIQDIIAGKHSSDDFKEHLDSDE